MKSRSPLALCGVTLILLFSITAFAQKPELVVQTGHTKAVDYIAFSPDDKILVSHSSDHTVIWDVSTGTELRTFKEGSVKLIALSPDGKILAGENDDNTIKLWDVSTGAEVRALKGHFTALTTLVFSPDGKILAGGSGDGITLWDVSTGIELPSLSGGDTDTIAFSPDGKTLVSGHTGFFYTPQSDVARGVP